MFTVIIESMRIARVRCGGFDKQTFSGGGLRRELNDSAWFGVRMGTDGSWFNSAVSISRVIIDPTN
jgi:hypothetical protein